MTPDFSMEEVVLGYLEDDEVSLLPDDPAAAVSRNTWSYSLADDGLDGARVAAALRTVAAALDARFSRHPVGGTFYAWCDETAGQLRCSLSS